MLSICLYYFNYSYIYFDTSLNLRQAVRTVIADHSVDFSSYQAVSKSLVLELRKSSIENIDYELELLGHLTSPRVLSVRLRAIDKYVNGAEILLRETMIEVYDD